MADSLDEALDSFGQTRSSSEPYGSALVIDSTLRTIIVPQNFIFGVYNDKNVLSVAFEMPRFYDEIDLSSFSIQINYLSASNVGNVYQVENPVIEDNKISFEWVLDRGVFLASGEVKFIVCLRELGENGVIVREFNTTVARGSVLEGIEVEDPENPEAYSILSHLQQIESRVNTRASAVENRYSDILSLVNRTIPIFNDLPTANGTYTLKLTVSNGNASYSWVSDT